MHKNFLSGINAYLKLKCFLLESYFIFEFDVQKKERGLYILERKASIEKKLVLRVGPVAEMGENCVYRWLSACVRYK